MRYLLFLIILILYNFFYTFDINAYDISIRYNQIYIDNKPLYGFFVFWNMTDYKEDELENEIKEIKKLGFKGITTEIKWSETEPKQGNYVFPNKYEKMIQMADKYGLLIQIQLSDHYLPLWLDDKYKAKDIYKNNHQGHYLPYTIFSDIVVKKILKWQADFIKHYSKYKNVISFLLSNEAGFCVEYDISCSDYSDFTLQKWYDFQIEKFGEIKIDYLPKLKSDKYYNDFIDFKNEYLRNFLTKKIVNAVNTNKTKIYANKYVPYEWDNNLNYYKLNSVLSKDFFYDNFFAVDLYGLNKSVIGWLNSMYNKPKWATETNMDFYRSSLEMKDYLIDKFKNGIFIQNIFLWDKQPKSFKAAYRYLDGSYNTKFKGVLFAIDDINKNGLNYINEYNKKLMKATKVSIALNYDCIDKFINISKKICPNYDKFCDIFRFTYEKFVAKNSYLFPMIFVTKNISNYDGYFKSIDNNFYIYFDKKSNYNTYIDNFSF